MFAGLDTQVLGISVDSQPCLTAWAESLGGITYPLLSDFWPHGAVVEKYGVLREEGYSERALFILDRRGIIRYIDIHDIDDQPDNQVVIKFIQRMDPIAAAKFAAVIAQPTEPVELPHGGIVMYCTSWCPSCRRARAWFAERNIQYTEVDIGMVPGAAAQVMKWADGNRTTPTFDIDGTIIVNFDEAKIREALKDKMP